MVHLWNIFFYKPLYNTLAFLVDSLPGNSLFLAIIILTIIVRLIIAPLSYKAIKTQIANKKIQPKLNEIKKNFSDKQEQAKKILELYKEYKINPFSSFFIILVQFPIVIALYWVFKDGSIGFDTNLLYSFINLPSVINTEGFGLVLTEKSLVLALLVGVTQFLQLSLSSLGQDTSYEGQSDQEKIMMQVTSSMKYTMPVLVAFFAFAIGPAVSLYWLTSNVFMIFQEYLLRKRLEKVEL
jgi:YidC/Oxa1 family membrane protein insertase